PDSSRMPALVEALATFDSSPPAWLGSFGGFRQMGRLLTRHAFALVLLLSIIVLTVQPALAASPTPTKQATAIGSGGAAASVDPVATQVAIDVLRRGGIAVDATVAADAALGVVV